MRRLVPLLCVVCAIAIGLTAWSRLRAGNAEIDVPEEVTPTATVPTADSLRQRLHAARRKCSTPALDGIVHEIHQRAQGSEAADDWHLLAEAMLERAQQRTHLLGMTVGKPLFSELPPALAADLDAGMAATARARELGDDSGEIHRIEAGLMSQRITGFGTALQWNARIGKALAAAAERDEQSAALHVALGLRKLLAPRWLGHDAEKALEHFEFAAGAAGDERPAVFAAMACQLLERRQEAIRWLEQATARNPNNGFARVVLGRVRRGEDDAFGRDVTAAEVAATR